MHKNLCCPKQFRWEGRFFPVTITPMDEHAATAEVVKAVLTRKSSGMLCPMDW